MNLFGNLSFVENNLFLRVITNCLNGKKFL